MKVSMDNLSSSVPGIPSSVQNGEGPNSRLRVLAEMLRRRGLDARLASYPVDGVESGFTDALAVTNPGDPGRGIGYVEKDGCLESPS
jgi:hypothetical protein